MTNALSSNNPVGTLASSAINRATRGNTTLSQLNNISQFRNSSLGSIVNGSFMNSSNSVDFTGGTFGANLGGFGGILGRASELAGVLDAPIRLIDRSAAEIFLASGGKFDVLREQVDSLSKLSAFEEFIDTSFSPPKITGGGYGSGESKSRIENPLRNFSSYNYKFTLGVLSAREFNNPMSYRSTGFKNYIIPVSYTHLTLPTTP